MKAGISGLTLERRYGEKEIKDPAEISGEEQDSGGLPPEEKGSSEKTFLLNV